MNLFKTLQVPEAQRYWIGQARVPICFLPGGPKTAVDRDGATLIDLLVDNERIAAIEPAGVAASADLPAIDLEAHHVWPTLIDMHAQAPSTCQVGPAGCRRLAVGSGILLPTGAIDFRPDLECLGPGSPMLGGSDVVAAKVEEVVDLIVG